MRTFTKDSLQGEFDEELRPIIKRTEEKLNEIIKEYTEECVKNDIETSSTEGMLLTMVLSAMSIARTSIFTREYKIKRKVEEINQVCATPTD